MTEGLVGLVSEQAVAALAGLGAFAAVVLVWTALLAPDPMQARLKRLKRRRDELSEGWRRPKRHPLRAPSAKVVVRSLVQRLNLLRNQTASKTAERLARAGWRSRDAVAIFLFCKLCLPFVCGAAAYLVICLWQAKQLPPVVIMLAPVLGALAGAYAPDVLLKNATQKREKAIQLGLPDALDLLVICAEAGLSLDAALNRVATEIGRSCPQVGEEFGLTAVELGFLPERRRALENLASRVQLPSVRGIVATLLQTEKYGTPLANSLRVLSADFRTERMLKAEAKAARLPAILTVPMILFIMPALMIVLIGPGIIKTMDSLSGF
jgi:tight adherence protein C